MARVHDGAGQLGDSGNPREDVARALGDSVLRALRVGDHAAARAAARALEAFVGELGEDGAAVADLRAEQQRKAR